MLHKSEHSLIKSFSPVLSHKMGKEICSISSAAFPDCSSFSAQHEDILKNRAPWDTDCQKTRPVLTFEKYCHRVTATTFHSASSQSFLHLISICSPGEPLCCLITRAHTPSSRWFSALPAIVTCEGQQVTAFEANSDSSCGVDRRYPRSSRGSSFPFFFQPERQMWRILSQWKLCHHSSPASWSLERDAFILLIEKILLMHSPANPAFPRFLSVAAHSLETSFQFSHSLERDRQHRGFLFMQFSKSRSFYWP